MMINVTLAEFKAGIHAKALFLKGRKLGAKVEDVAIPVLTKKIERAFEVQEEKLYGVED